MRIAVISGMEFTELTTERLSPRRRLSDREESLFDQARGGVI